MDTTWKYLVLYTDTKGALHTTTFEDRADVLTFQAACLSSGHQVTAIWWGERPFDLQPDFFRRNKPRNKPNAIPHGT